MTFQIQKEDSKYETCLKGKLSVMQGRQIDIDMQKTFEILNLIHSQC